MLNKCLLVVAMMVFAATKAYAQQQSFIVPPDQISINKDSAGHVVASIPLSCIGGSSSYAFSVQFVTKGRLRNQSLVLQPGPSIEAVGTPPICCGFMQAYSFSHKKLGYGPSEKGKVLLFKKNPIDYLVVVREKRE